MMKDAYRKMAEKLDNFVFNYCPYYYYDEVEARDDHIAQIEKDLRKGEFEAYQDYLKDVVRDAVGTGEDEEARKALKELDKLEKHHQARYRMSKGKKTIR